MPSVTYPSVNTTIFPKVNLIDPHDERAIQRDQNGRIFGKYGDPAPEVEGTCFRVSFPHDLQIGTGAVYDLLEDCGTPTIIDLN